MSLGEVVGLVLFWYFYFGIAVVIAAARLGRRHRRSL